MDGHLARERRFNRANQPIYKLITLGDTEVGKSTVAATDTEVAKATVMTPTHGNSSHGCGYQGGVLRRHR